MNATVHDAIASLHAGIIADYLTAALLDDRAAKQDILDRARQLDAKHPGGPSLADQIHALRTAQAA